MNFALISPRLSLQKGDFLGSGVPYWPLELAILANYIRDKGDQVNLIDLFGADPTVLSDEGDYYLQGVPLSSSQWQNDLKKADIYILYAISYMSHQELLSCTKSLKKQYPKKPILVLENSQAVTAYSLASMSSAFLGAGADILICGEPYFNWHEIKQYAVDPINHVPPQNLITRHSIQDPIRNTEQIDRYPIPAWDLIKLESYWRLPYSHGPKTKRFFPILTSRGCPYPCDFCVVPETNNRRWRGNKPEDVVAEMIYLRDRFGVYDFQVEDLNPTVQRTRWETICKLLVEKRAGIRFYFVSGTKAETLHLDQIKLFAKAGCKYISISPESGSAKLMKIIGKKFDYKHGVALTAACHQNGIKTQGCFLVGHPDETIEDFQDTKRYLKQMVKAGLDEVAIFVVSPFAGSSLYLKNKIAMNNSNVMPSFSPVGRVGYETFEKRRKELIVSFFIAKSLKGFSLWAQGIRALLGKPYTKMENLPRRIAYVYYLRLKNTICSSRFMRDGK